MLYSLASAPSECLIKVQLTLLAQGLGAISLPICSAKALPDMFLCFHSSACHPGSHQCTDPNIPAFRELHCLILGQTSWATAQQASLLANLAWNLYARICTFSVLSVKTKKLVSSTIYLWFSLICLIHLKSEVFLLVYEAVFIYLCFYFHFHTFKNRWS